MSDKRLQLAEELVPIDYFVLSDELKNNAYNIAYGKILKSLNSSIPDENSRMPILMQIIDNSIRTHENDEEYEICQFWHDFKHYVGVIINVNEQ